MSAFLRRLLGAPGVQAAPEPVRAPTAPPEPAVTEYAPGVYVSR